MFSLYSAFPSKQPTAAGFSLIELLVSISIIVLVLSIVVTRQSSFNSAVLLRSQAYEIALTVREAQLSAVSAVNTGATAESFRSVIGVEFNTSAGSNQRYNLFIDSGDNWYGSGDTGYGTPGLLDRRFEIRDIRYNGSSYSRVAITFARPNFDARFKTSAGGALLTSGRIEIDVQPKGGSGTGCPDDIRTIEITSTGQVSVIKC